MSISVKYLWVGEGKCILCRKDKSEVFTVQSSDQSITGTLDAKCLNKLIAMRVATVEEPQLFPEPRLNNVAK